MEKSSQIPSKLSKMASNPTQADDPCVDQKTIVLKKKRWRRVDFADSEITSAHIFNRDEDFETPPDDSAKNRTSVDAADPEDALLRLLRDLATFQKTYPTEEILVTRKSLLRPIESRSPRSSLFGSATSNGDIRMLLQRICSRFSNNRQGRVAETRLLLNKLVFEKARGYFFSVKHEKLLKRYQLLNSAMQGFQTLKSNNAQCLSALAK